VSTRFGPSAKDLLLLSEHLYYEIWMTFDLAMGLALGRVPRRQPVWNAAIETFPMHVRQLDDFFWKQRSGRRIAEEDAHAGDYFDPGAWEALRPTRPAQLNAVWLKTGWGVVHLTYRRANATPQDKVWDHIAICEALAPVVRCFLDNVDPSKLDPGWFAEARKCMDNWSAFMKRRGGRQARTTVTTATATTAS
jgi:hypothetical protein